jgi:hypothetical protein
LPKPIDDTEICGNLSIKGWPRCLLIPTQALSDWTKCQAVDQGCRSIRVIRSFRIIFVICEECRCVPECKFC